MQISEEERQAIQTVLKLGEQFGYGNLISHLRTAWARMLMTKHNMTEDTARLGAHGGTIYPFGMQDDLLNGHWDETGERYKS